MVMLESVYVTIVSCDAPAVPSGAAYGALALPEAISSTSAPACWACNDLCVNVQLCPVYVVRRNTLELEVSEAHVSPGGVLCRLTVEVSRAWHSDWLTTTRRPVSEKLYPPGAQSQRVGEKIAYAVLVHKHYALTVQRQLRQDALRKEREHGGRLDHCEPVCASHRHHPTHANHP